MWWRTMTNLWLTLAPFAGRLSGKQARDFDQRS
jgi:hypothetical protein